MRGIVTRTVAVVALGAAAWLGGVSPAGASASSAPSVSAVPSAPSVFDGATASDLDLGYGRGGHNCVTTTAWGDAWCPGKPLS